VPLGLADHVGDAADHRDIDQAVGGICRGFDENHRNSAIAHGVLRRQPDRGFVDAVGEAHRADGEARKRLRKQGFRPAIQRLRVQNDVARADEGEDRGGNRRHAGREQRAFIGALVNGEPVLDDLAVGMIEPRINQARAHPLGRLAPTRDEIEEVLSVFGGPEDEGRGQEDRRFDGAFRQLRIVAVVQHQRFGVQHVVADVGLRRKRFHHGLPRCLDSKRCPALGSFAMTIRSGAVDATASNGSSQRARISVARSGNDFTAPEAGHLSARQEGPHSCERRFRAVATGIAGEFLIHGLGM
jgi:hypothetical protein